MSYESIKFDFITSHLHFLKALKIEFLSKPFKIPLFLYYAMAYYAVGTIPKKKKKKKKKKNVLLFVVNVL